jgi:hypothetical protein|tara:strand:+ start:383 stop:550 length:168 start_codon:yes stop_codon:yes gene_type:complete
MDNSHGIMLMNNEEKKPIPRKKTPHHGLTKKHKNKTKYDRKKLKKKINDIKEELE